MPPAGIEPAIPASDRPLAQALERAATCIGMTLHTALEHSAVVNLLPFRILIIMNTCMFSLSNCYNTKFPFQISYHLSGQQNLSTDNWFLLNDCVRERARARVCVCVQGK
jgi:Na+/melibiose symporter-like transporter